MKQPSNLNSAKWYDENAQDFLERTLNLDMTALYEPFLRHMRPGGHILDAGCGPGRDTKAFIKQGFKVTAIDASKAMVELASQVTGQRAKLMTFQEVGWEEEFDGIWACASLLHVPRADIEDVFRRFEKALKTDGIWYLSFKQGAGEREKAGRFFNDYTEEELKALISQFPSLRALEFWSTGDIRQDRHAEQWHNVVLRKVKP